MKNNIPTLLSPPKPLYSVLFISIAAAMLAGCQSTSGHANSSASNAATINDANYLNRVTANTSAYQALFVEDDNNGDVNAHRRLLQSLHRHLTSDHVAVTQMRHHAVPFIKEDSVDALSDSLLRTVFETFAKKLDKEDYSDGSYDSDENSSDADSYEKPYRDADRYLAEPSALYLNYIDEYNDRLPTDNYNIDRQTGMSDDFVAATDRAIAYVDNTNDCVLDYSYELDGLVEADPNLTTNSNAVKPLKKAYSDCLTETKSSYSNILTNATGYQKQYITAQNACVQQFDRNLNDMLSPSRSTKKMDYDLYDSVFKSYDVCYDRVNNLHVMEPAAYISYGLTENRLNHQQGLVACAGNLESAHKTLGLAGKTYKNAPQAYADAYYEFSACEAESYNQVYYTDEAASAAVMRADADADAAAEDYAVDYVQDSSVQEDSSEEYMADDSDVAEDYATEDYDSEDYEADSDTEDAGRYGGMNEYSGVVGQMFNWFKRTPAQISASNQYNYQYLTLNSVSKFNAKNKQLDSVYSYDFVSPTMLSSIQLPVGINFNAAQITVDPSAVLPIIALAKPDSAPLPEEMSASTVRFNMPEELATQLPANVIYDIFVDAIEKSMGNLDSEYFTAVDISQDAYAKQIGATKAIKVNFGSKQTGEMVGGIIKHVAQSLEDYVAAHPEQFPEESRIKASIDKWQEYNSHYQTKDAGSILQLIEAVGPISFNRVNYYYLDNSDRLLGKQVRTLVGGDLLGSKSTFLSRTRYDQTSFSQHPLAALFSQSFGPSATTPIDGNAWLQATKDKQYKLEQARYARYDYERESSGNDDTDDYSDEGNADYADYAKEAVVANTTLNEPSEYERRTITSVSKPAVKTDTTNDNNDAVSAD